MTATHGAAIPTAARSIRTERTRCTEASADASASAANSLSLFLARIPTPLFVWRPFSPPKLPK
jgi:hypothetical protein